MENYFRDLPIPPELFVWGLAVSAAGMVYLILPHAWHRYRPDTETGWTESWIEVQRPVVAGLLGKDLFTAALVLRSVGIEV